MSPDVRTGEPDALGNTVLVTKGKPCSLLGRSPNLVLVDTIGHDELVDLFFDVIVPLESTDTGTRACVISVDQTFTPDQAARLPGWIGELRNRTTFTVVAVGDQSDWLTRSLAGGADGTADTNSRARVTNARTGNRLIFRDFIVQSNCREDRTLVPIRTTLTVTVDRPVTAGDPSVLRVPDIRDELSLSDLEKLALVAITVEPGVCSYEQAQPLWISRERFSRELVPALDGGGRV